MNNIYLYNGPDEGFENYIKENDLEVDDNIRRLYFRDVIKFIDQVQLDTVMEEIKGKFQEGEIILVVKTEDFFSIELIS